MPNNEPSQSINNKASGVRLDIVTFADHQRRNSPKTLAQLLQGDQLRGSSQRTKQSTINRVTLRSEGSLRTCAMKQSRIPRGGDRMTRRVLLYPGDDGYVVAEVPSLPGCVSQGKTRDEALVNVREAISLHEEVLRERGEPIPEDNVELVEVAA